MNMLRIHIAGLAILLSVSAAPAQQPVSLSLSQCRELALAHSEDLQQADNRLRQAELDSRIASAARLPKIEGSATGAYVFPDIDMMGMEMCMRGTYMAGINLTQPIYTGGKIAATNKLARIGQEVADEQLRKTRMDVIVEADNAYWSYIAVSRKVRMLESCMAQMDTLYAQTSSALAAGMAIENDLLRISAKRSEIDYQLQRARNGADLCRMVLCRVIGSEFATPIKPTDTVFVVSAPEIATSGIEARPEYRMLEKQVAAGEQKIRDARSEMLPVVGLSAGYSYYGNIDLKSMVDAGNGTMVPYTQEFRDGIGIAMISVKIPIFHWGEGRKKVRKARYDLQNSQLDLQKNSRLMSIEVQQAIRNVEDGYRLIATAEYGLAQAVENLRVMRNRYVASMATLTDLLDAQTQWQQAESNLIEAQTQYRIYQTEYLRSTGRLN